MSTTDITPPRCHWCGGETHISIAWGTYTVDCSTLGCRANGPFRGSIKEAVAAYMAVAPALGKTYGTPRKPGWYVRCDHNWQPIEMLRFDPTPGVVVREDGARAYYRYLGPIPSLSRPTERRRNDEQVPT